MIGRLLILFLVVPLVELYLLLWFADATSILTAITTVILTGICGSVLAARQGTAAFRNFQIAISAGRVPGAEVVDGLLIAFAAALLLTPGLLTDTVGLLLLIPWTRQRFRKAMIRRYASRFKVVTFPPGAFSSGAPGGRGGNDPDTVDASFRPTPSEPSTPQRLPRN